MINSRSSYSDRKWRGLGGTRRRQQGFMDGCDYLRRCFRSESWMTLWFRGTRSGQRTGRTRSGHDRRHSQNKTILQVLQHAASGAQTFSSARPRQSSLESSELSMSICSHDVLVRCSQLLASPITAGGMRTTQAARPDTRSLNSVSLSHSSVSALYTWTYFIRLPLSWERPPRM